MTTRLWSWRSVRLRVAVCIALALTIEGLMRSNLNMVTITVKARDLPKMNWHLLQAMVCMLNETAIADGRQLRNASHPVKCEVLKFGNEQVYKYVSPCSSPLQQIFERFGSFGVDMGYDLAPGQ